MIIVVDCGWDKQILLVLPVEYLPYLLLEWSIWFRRPSSLRYYRRSTSVYSTDKEDNLAILPGDLVN